MGVFSVEHPNTAVTALINRVITNSDGSDGDGTVETELGGILQSIKLQPNSGATEAARAVRKKLKYGSRSEQWKALNVLELLVANGGKPCRSLYNDEKLILQIRSMIHNKGLDSKIRKRVISLVYGWYLEYKDEKMYQGLVSLYSSSNVKRYIKKTPDFMADEADQSTPFEAYEDSEGESIQESVQESVAESFAESVPERGSRRIQARTNEDINRQFKIPKINYEKERPKILMLIADSTSSALRLSNILTSSVNRARGETSLDNDKATIEFQKSRQIRRKVLRYLQLVDKEEYLGSLIHSNDVLVDALQKYDEYSKPVDESEVSSYDEDDDSIVSEAAAPKRPPPIPRKPSRLGEELGLVSISDDEVSQDDESQDEDDPFGDLNKSKTPVRWR